MLRAPYVRAAVAGHTCLLPPLEYRSGGRHGAASMLAQLRGLEEAGGPATADAAPSLALWLYRSSLLRRLWLEGIVFDAVAAHGLTARDLTALLHRTLQTPPCLRGEDAAAQEEAVGLVRGVQREFALRILGAIVDEKQWRWTLREAWDCAATLVGDSVHPDDVVSLSLLLPLARRLASRGDGGRTLHAGLRELQARKLHGGVLWLLARRAAPTPWPEQKLLEAATAAACAAPACVMLSASGSSATGDDEARMASAVQAEDASAATPQDSVFLPFWRLLLYEMVHHAHAVLRDPTAPERRQAGALLSLRRVLCSFRRHGRVRPVLELHLALTAPWRGCSQTDPSAAQARYAPLVFREALLLDAYALLTLGHVGETAVDVDEAVVRGVTTIQSRCLSHLEALAQNEPEAGFDRDAMGLHRGARAGVQRRLREGIRLSFKLLLRRGAYETIRQTLARCPALGGTWEGGKALVMLGRHMEAVSVFTDFLNSTRQHFASGIPRHIRAMMLEAVEGAARGCLSDPGGVPGRLLHLYELTRTWDFPVPAAVTFAAILSACCGDGAAPAGHTAGDGRRRLDLMATLLRRHLAVAAYVRDGLLLATVEIYVALLAECRDGALPSHLELLHALQRAHPGLPVYRVALLHFLRVGHRDAVTAVLQHIVPSCTDAVVCLTPLQELPLAALEALSRHVAQTECGGQRMLSAVGTALECRRFAEEQRLPWQCHLCRHWNKKNASACRLCGSLELAVVRCRACGGFSPTSAPDCLLCGAETHERAGEQGVPHVKEDCSIFPLRKWRCGRCNHTNEPHHVFYCAKCGSVQPALEEALTQTSFHCHVCSRHNPLGLLRPWCPACGTLSPAAAAGPPKTLWRCVECHTLTPWLLTHCQGCGGTKPAATSRFDTPWFSPVCSSCRATNPAWGVVCHGCGARLAAARENEDKRGEELEVNPAGGEVSADAGPTSCRSCGRSRLEEGEVACQTCFAPRPGAAFLLWVCLRGNCLGVNLHRAAGEGLLVCGHCGVAHDLAVVGRHNSNPLRFREPCASVREGGGGGEDPPLAAPSALLLPVPSAPRVCFACGAYLQLQNVAQICPACFHCGYASSHSSGASAAEHDVALRLALQATLQALHRVEKGLVSRPNALSLLRSTTLAFQRAREPQLPWRGCDLSNGMRCCVRSRVPVMEDDTVHSSVRDVAELIRSVCAIASSTATTTTDAAGSREEFTATSGLERRAWVLLALDWVDLMNRTTEYDELGFDVLAQLCMVVRPQQGAHIHRETRWAYLRHMKLPREWFVNGVVCPTCLLPKTGETREAAHTCRCKVRVTDAAKTHAPVLTTTF
ncbi:uncharacterized protein Tco025E_04304 [Trypanosoma conorhini]|uniref:RanBP2-type domain-containing protein n=1 Tax=Trypanosoma conorhini TaxID=83891 RepID=A0A3R7MQU3_9TRYP|nr:uncharacterized protein Tco025E_04304 [Trypanosoma conorhini]RNF19171.1 hypothetical protein Tco025E_04304 [Trypanosoma conorhini]